MSQNGTLVYLDGGLSDSTEELVWLSLDGTTERASRHERNYGSVRLSPDESMIALEVISDEDGVSDIWVLERERDQMTRLTFSDTLDYDPLWTPDGKYIVYARIGKEERAFNIYRIRADGTGQPERLTESRTRHTPISWTPDGSELIFMDYSQESVDLMRYRPGQDPEVVPFVNSEFGEFGGFVSPDGRWVVYLSDMSGRGEIYVRPLNGDGQATKISTDGSAGARWAKDGRSILYRTPQGKLMSVAVSTDGDRLKAELPVERTDFPLGSYSFLWDTAKDGRVLAYRDLDTNVQRRIPSVIVNWARELEETVPQPK